MLERAAKNAYSWWWASHVRTKQSKWLDQNLQDMEEKVEYILKIIDEDGDTFRQRAEMYYQKRPEIINFVEDSFREYRALAERYDHLSRELQSANRMIAAVYPERFQLGMDDNDDFDLENLPTMKLHPDKKFSKNPPAAPNLPILKIPSSAKKNAKMPSRLMSKKGLLKINDAEAAFSAPNSGLSKSEALQRIDKLQKEILAFQTEKEFVRSSYKSGLQKYWDIEKQVTEMQVEVSNLEDEFGIGTVIEDDEARCLMTAAALRSCQETLTLLQQQQEQSAEDARVELERIEKAHEKFKTLKEKLICNQAHQPEHLEKNLSFSLNFGSNKSEQEMDSAEPNIHDLETLRTKMKEELKAKLGTSLTMSELAGKVDELVDKVISLESAVSSQSANVKRLRSEANELHMHIQSLEEEKGTLIEGSYKESKVRELEEELQRAKSLNKRVKEQNNHLQTRFIEASFNLVDLSEKFQNVKPDEEDEDIYIFNQARVCLGVKPFKRIQLNEIEISNNVAKISEDERSKEVEMEAEMLEQNACNIEELKNHQQTSSSGHVASHLRDHNVSSGSDANEELGVSAMEMWITPGCSSAVSKGETMLEEVKEDGIIDQSNSSKIKSVKNDLTNQKKSKLNSRSGSAIDVKSEYEIIPGHGSTVMNGMVLQEEPEENNPLNSGPSKKENGKSLFQPVQQDISSDFHEGQERATEDTNPQKGFSGSNNNSAPGNDIQIAEDVIEDKGTKGALPKHNASSNFGKGNFIQSNQGRDLHNLPERRLKDQDEFILPNQDNHSDDHLVTCQVGNLQHANQEKTGASRESIDHVEKHSYDFILHNQDNLTDDPSNKDHTGDLQDSNPLKVNERMDRVALAENMEMKHETLGRSNVALAAENHNSSQREHSGDESRQTDADMIENMKQDGPSDQGKDHEQKKPNVLNSPGRKLSAHLDELGVEEDDHPNWKELFMSGLDDREKILLKEYTSALRNYKDTRKKLNEMEKKKRASLFQYCIQIQVLRSANAEKDAKIQSLEKRLNFVQGNQEEIPESKERETTDSLHVPDDQSSNIEQVTLQDLLHKETFDFADTIEETITQKQRKISNVQEDKRGETPNFPSIEEKIQRDIDELQEENIEFWMKFSNTFCQIQKFQNTVLDLQAEIAKLKKVKQQDGSANPRSQSSEILPIYRHLREIHTELTLWLDRNTVLKDDLQSRLSSLSSVQDEITTFSNAGFEAEDAELSDCQAAKFQGEVLNMKLENKKVASELQSGEERVRILQVEIERTLSELDDEFEISVKNQKSRYTAVRSRIPLRSFLFGVKLKKQKPSSLLACVSTALQKQHSDLRHSLR